MLLSGSPSMTLILSDEVFEETCVVAPVIGGIRGSINDLSIDTAVIVIAIREVSPELPVGLVMVLLSLSPLVYNCCPV